MSKNQLNGLLSGDKRVIQNIYDTTFLSIKKYILKNSGQLEDAEDVFQESLVVLFRKANQGKIELTCSLSTYIYSISRYIWLDRLRRRRKILNVAIDEDQVVDSFDLIEEIHINERRYLFQKHFSALHVECQKLLTFFFESKSMNEIAIAMGYKDDVYARKRKFRCKDHLVRSIKKDSNFSEFL